MRDQIMNVVVRNAINTCYIDSLIIALFYSPSIISKMLNNDIESGTAIYLQEYIKHNIINNLHKGISVNEDTMHIFRYLCMENGWLSNNQQERLRQQDVNEFYIFLVKLLKGHMLEIKKKTIEQEGERYGNKEIIPFIPLSIPENKTDVEVKDLLHNWLFNNEIINNNNKSVHSYYILNIPDMVGLSINRFNSKGNRIHTNVNVKMKITLYQQMDHNRRWIIHSIICHRGNTVRCGHYYTIFMHNEKWFLFDDNLDPSIKMVSNIDKIMDKKIIELIKRECVFLIYRYNG